MGKMTMILLGIIVVVFVLQLTIAGFTQMFYLNPANLQIWQFVTSVFLHGGITHILFNAYALFLFGPILEQKVGGRNFLLIFFIGGIAGNLLYWASALIGITNAPALGASGAIYAIFGALAIIVPHLQLYIFGVIPMNIRHAAIMWIALEFFGSFNPGSGIASAAHLGGLVMGLALGKYFERNSQSSPVAQYYWRRRSDY